MSPRAIDKDWLQRADDLASFVKKHGRMPSKYARSPRERFLGRWVQSRRQDARARPEWFEQSGRKAIVDAAAPSWQDNQHDRRWEARVHGTQSFVETQSRLPTVSDSPQLGHWITKRRSQKRAGTLSADRIEHLDGAIPRWGEADFRSRHFEMRVEEIARFVSDHGRLPSAMKEPSLYGSLLRWRERHSTGILPSERVRMLDESIPGWQKDCAEAAFLERVSEVESFVDEHGHLPVGDDDKSLENTIGHWRRKHAAGKIPPERVEILDRRIPGWLDDMFRVRVREVATFVSECGDFPTAKMRPDLYASVRYWRGLCARGELSTRRVEFLDQMLPGWSLPDRRFAVRVQEVVAFVSEQGRLPAGAEYGPYSSLRRWRLQHKAGELSADHIALLDRAIPGWRRNFGEKGASPKFRRLVLEIKSIADKHGRFPQKGELGGIYYRLRDWRRQHADGDLSLERVAFLDEHLPGWSDSGYTPPPSFADRVQEVAAFVAEHGRFPRSSAEPILYGAMCHWRRKSAAGRLSAEDAATLDRELPGWRLR